MAVAIAANTQNIRTIATFAYKTLRGFAEIGRIAQGATVLMKAAPLALWAFFAVVNTASGAEIGCGINGALRVVCMVFHDAIISYR